MPIYKTKKIKDGKQQYRVYVNYTSRDGKYKSKSKLVYGAAEAKLAELQLRAEIEETKPDAAITIQKLFDEYTTAKQSEIRKTSYIKLEGILRHYVLPYFADVKLDKLTAKRLQEWKNEISQLPFALVSKNNMYKEFRGLLNYAIKMEYITKNPLTSVGPFRDAYLEEAKDKLRYYTADQFKQYIAVALSHCDKLDGWGFYVFFNIAFFTGMRKGEINALKWNDIEGNIIHVRRSITQKIKGGDIESPPKNKSSYRDLQMPRQLVVILAEHKRRQQASPQFSEEFRVCGGARCLRDSSVTNRNNQYAEEAGLPHIRIHDFRHTHASLLINEGINVQEIARRLGHSNVEITWKTYAHLYPREEERAIKVLESL